MTLQPTTVAGLNIQFPEGTPLAALVVLKYLDNESIVTYITASTDSLTAVEALGMAALAQMKLSDLIREAKGEK